MNLNVMKRLVTLLVALTTLGCATALAQEYVPTPVTVSKEKVKLNGKVYLSHVVLERQTLYGISKAYGVTEDELYEANPSLRETGLQKNAIILVPYREAAPVAVTDPQAPSYTEHVVRWYEDIDDIAKRYGVSVKDIMELNGLKNRKLTTRQVLKIPVRGLAAATPAEESETAVEDLPQEAEQQPVVEHTDAPVAQDLQPENKEVVPDSTLLQMRRRDGVEFALILPIQNGNRVSEVNMDFYSGALLALKDLEAEGLKIQMHVNDLNAGLPAASVLKRCDFVLGPVASRDLEAVLQRVEGEVPVISPLDQKAAALSGTYQSFIQAPSAVDNQYEDLGQWVKEDARDRDRVLLITEKGAGNVSAAVAIRSALARREVTYEVLNYAIVEGRGIPAILTDMLTQTGANRVVVASESEAFVGDVVRNLGIMLGKGYEIIMYAPSKVRTFDTIDGSAYHNVSLHICTNYHADYSNPRVDAFVRAYRSLCHTEPSQFAFQGYDTVRYFVLRCARYGSNWPRYTGLDRSAGLHTDFLFDTDANGNHHNVAVRRIIFQKDYTTTIFR